MIAGTVGRLLACLWAWTAAAAYAAEPPWYAGMEVADVQLRAPQGGLPEESLDPLLQAQAGAPLRLADVQADLGTLIQVGQFAAVEAEVQPWVTFDEEGDPVEAVLLAYVVYPAPRIGRVRFEGESPVGRRRILEVANLAAGRPFYEGLDDEEAAGEVRRFLTREGYPDATASVTADPMGDGRLALTLHVDPGAPHLLEHLSFSGDLGPQGPTRQQLVRWARKAGLQEGKPFTLEAVAKARQEVRQQLASMRHGPLRRRRGWVGARVNPLVVRSESGGARITFNIELGPRLELEVAGLRWRGERKARAALGIDERLRLTRGWLDEAPERMERSLQQVGWLEADVEVSLIEPETREGVQVLHVQVDKGPRHSLRVGAPPAWIGMTFEGNEALTDAELQRIFDQASPEVIRRDFVNEQELKAGMTAARETYRARGYQEAELSLVEMPTKPKRLGPVGLLLSPLRAAIGKPRPRVVTPRIQVHEGPLTLLDRVDVVGEAPDVDLQAIDEASAQLRGTPYSPQRIEALSRQLVERHRLAGYLDADARISVEPAGPNAQAARIEVQPGPQVLLRSVVTRGPRLTQPSFIRREVESTLTLGEPLTTQAMDSVRSDLYEVGSFRSVNLALLGDGAQRDLVIDVQERGRWAFEIGSGLSTDLGLRTFGRASRRHLWGRAHHIDLLGQVGLVWRSESIRDWVPDITNPEWRLALSYTAPHFPARPQNLVVDALLREVRVQRTWRMARSGGGVVLENRLGPRTELRTGARVETRQFMELDVGALLPNEPWVDRVADQPPPTMWRVQESLLALLVHDLRNDPVSPTRGMLVSVNTEWAPGLPWDRWRGQQVTSFLKASVRGTAYVPLGGLILRSTLEGGHGISLNGGVIPLEDRFRMGGTGSLRGFRRDSVGPHNRTTLLNVDWPTSLAPVVDYSRRVTGPRWVPTGGDTSALGIFELLLPFPAMGMTRWDGYALALFADVGNTWLVHPNARATSSLDRWAGDVPLLRVGTGVGARVATPVGPLQLDIALNPQAAWSKGRRRALLVEGWEEPPVRAHLTLGALF